MRSEILAMIAAPLVAFLLLTGVAVAHGYSAGPIRVEHPWAAATPPAAAVGAAYMVIVNTGRAPLRLIGASTPVAERVEIHTMSMEGGIMRMRPIAGGLLIPAGGQVKLAPGGMHAMLIGLKGRLIAEDFVALTLRFEGGLNVNVELYVEERAGGHGH